MTELHFETVNNHLRCAVFRDAGGRLCSLQESSATEPTIWLGLDNSGQRMLLTQEQVKALLPALHLFANIGDLP